VHHSLRFRGDPSSFVLVAAALCGATLAAPVAAQEARFSTDPDLLLPAPGDRLEGLVGWRSSPRLFGMMKDLGADKARYRRTAQLQELSLARYIGEDFRDAEQNGFSTWLTCVGTPSSLSPDPGATENAYGTGLPEFARYPPTNPVAWADVVLVFIAEMESEFAVVPKHVEIWNEPDRVEWFKGSAAEWLEFYVAVSQRIRQIRPGILIGGPALAGWRSELGGTESFLFTLQRTAVETGAPLDFISWHHYAPSTEILYSDLPARLQEYGYEYGMRPFETVISEWNIYPSAEGAAGPEFDGPHAAANFTGFRCTSLQTGLDESLFFLDQDEDNNPGITDLTGVGLGLITQHGVKKPVARMLEILSEMAQAERPAVISPAEEWSVRVQASRAGACMRLAISNDVVTGLWVFSNRARENGMDPGWLYPLWLAAGGPLADEQDLIAAGLTPEQAQATLGFIPEVTQADRFTREPRPVVIEILGGDTVALYEVRRFTDSVNAPAQHQTVLYPLFEAVENTAALAEAQAGADYLVSEGYSYTAADLLAIQGDFFEWAEAEGIVYGHAVRCNRIMSDTLRNERLAGEASLNAQPETLVLVEAPGAAGVSLTGREILFQMDPNTTLVVDVVISALIASP